MYTLADIKETFGEEEVFYCLDRIQYMAVPTRQQFIDACMKWNTRPSAGWNGGFFGDPFIPVRIHEQT